MNQIELNFKKSITGLAGNPFGKSVYKEQVASKLNPDLENVIVFPDQIEDIAISFIQGFFTELGNKYSYDQIRRIIKIKAGSDFVEQKIWENIY